MLFRSLSVRQHELHAPWRPSLAGREITLPHCSTECDLGRYSVTSGRCYDHNLKRFCSFFGKQMPYFLKKKNVTIFLRNLHNTIWRKNAKLFGENIFLLYHRSLVSMLWSLFSATFSSTFGENVWHKPAEIWSKKPFFLVKFLKIILPNHGQHPGSKIKFRAENTASTKRGPPCFWPLARCGRCMSDSGETLRWRHFILASLENYTYILDTHLHMYQRPVQNTCYPITLSESVIRLLSACYLLVIRLQLASLFVSNQASNKRVLKTVSSAWHWVTLSERVSG
jgi:hypothetical protein